MNISLKIKKLFEEWLRTKRGTGLSTAQNRPSERPLNEAVTLAMIYVFPKPNEPIRQGDIFQSVPLVSLDPDNLLISHDEKSFEQGNWIDHTKNGLDRVIARIEPVDGIVVTQDCDTVRDDYVAFFRIEEFAAVTKLTVPPTPTPKWWAEAITKHPRVEQKWFYLPPDPAIGFSEKMAADFQAIISVSTKFLSKNVGALRVGRLNDEADEHFREKVAQYFRRYPYDEWYPLDKDEFEAYKKSKSRADTEPKQWQK